MNRLAEIQAHIASMDGLRDIVGAMRSLAGMRVQEAQHALRGIRRYAESMAGTIGAALLLTPDPVLEPGTGRGHRALVLCAAEHGFVGGFNERMLEAARATLQPTDRLFVLGSRGAALAVERGCRPSWTAPQATRITGAPDAINRLADELYARILRGEISRIDVVFARYRQGMTSQIETRLLLPLDTKCLAPSPLRQAPIHNLSPRRLLEKLVSEYVFALLTEAAVESIASENAARFAAMESAHNNVSKKLTELRQSANQARQDEITAELLDLMTGAEAMRPASESP